MNFSSLSLGPEMFQKAFGPKLGFLIWRVAFIGGVVSLFCGLAYGAIKVWDFAAARLERPSRAELVGAVQMLEAKRARLQGQVDYWHNRGPKVVTNTGYVDSPAKGPAKPRIHQSGQGSLAGTFEAPITQNFQSSASNASSRDPDSLYQLGDVVATVTGAQPDVSHGIINFALIKRQPNLNASMDYEYRDWIIRCPDVKPIQLPPNTFAVRIMGGDVLGARCYIVSKRSG